MYTLTKEGICVIRATDGACIPFSDGNTDYEAYKQWLSEGNTPEPYVPTPAELNAPIHAQLAAIDQKKIRTLSDAIVKNDKKRLEDLELEAEALRAQLVQE